MGRPPQFSRGPGPGLQRKGAPARIRSCDGRERPARLSPLVLCASRAPVATLTRRLEAVLSGLPKQLTCWAESRCRSGSRPGEAEGEGFEPSIRLTTDNGFRDRPQEPARSWLGRMFASALQALPFRTVPPRAEPAHYARTPSALRASSAAPHGTRSRRGAALQAGGHRFDPGTLHSS
jgi:hypothetical protein